MGRLFDTLPMNEREKITKYIAGTVGAPTVSLEHLLRFWDRNKVGLFDMFGGNFIIEKEISFARDAHQLAEDMDVKFSIVHTKETLS